MVSGLKSLNCYCNEDLTSLIPRPVLLCQGYSINSLHVKLDNVSGWEEDRSPLGFSSKLRLLLLLRNSEVTEQGRQN